MSFNHFKISCLILLSFLCILFLSIGYAQVAYDMEVLGDVSLTSQNGIVITKVEKVKEVGSVKSKVVHYVGTVLTMSVELDDLLNSKVIYKVKVENTMDEDYLFSKYLFDDENAFQLYTNLNIIPSILSKEDIGLDEEDILTLGDVLEAHTSRYFYVSYQYCDEVNLSNLDSQILESGMVHFKFIPIHIVEHTNILFPDSVLDGDNIVVSFTDLIPSDIIVYQMDGKQLEKGIDYQYEFGTFQMNDIHTSLKIVESYE